MGGWLENWRVIPISAFNYVIVEVVAEIGNRIWALKGPVSGFVGCIPLPSFDSIITRNH